jgi:tetratricopeptide (TPR) repeat protein
VKCTFVVVVCWCVASRAYAQPDPAPASSPDNAVGAFDTSKVEAVYERGTKHYDLGEFDAAAAAFKEAYALMPDPTFLFNIGQAYRQANKCSDARTAYKSYLRNLPDADNRQKVEQFLVELDACVAREEARLAAMRPPPPIVIRPALRHRTLRLAGFVTAGGGVLLAAGGLFFSARAADAASDLEARCAMTCNADDIRGLDERGRSASRNATILYVAGGAAIVTGAALVFYATMNAEAPVTVAPVKGGAVIGKTVRF